MPLLTSSAHSVPPSTDSRVEKRQRSCQPKCVWQALYAAGMVAVPNLRALLSRYSELSDLAGPAEQLCEDASSNAEAALQSSSKGRAVVASLRVRPPSTAVRIGPLAPRLSWKDKRDVEGRLWEVASSLSRTTPSSPPSCEVPASLKRYLRDVDLPHCLWVWGCGSGDSGPTEPKLYVRRLPVCPEDLRLGAWKGPRTRVAHLRMSSQAAGSEGGHSTTCRAQFTFDEARSWWSRKKVYSATVIAKTARPLIDSQGRRSRRKYQEDLRMLDNEAELYDAFPPALVGCKEVQYSDTCYFRKSTSTYLVDDPGSALVPKFYGFYVPYEPAVPATSVRGSSYRQPITGEVSPILLIEDCGTEIRAHKQSDRERCVPHPLRHARS